MPVAPSARKALRLSAVAAKTAISKTHIFRLIKQGAFPPSHKLSQRVAVWNEADIDAWLAEKFAGSQS